MNDLPELPPLPPKWSNPETPLPETPLAADTWTARRDWRRAARDERENPLPRRVPTTQHTLILEWDTDERRVLYIQANGGTREQIAAANHDTHGWGGLDLFRETVAAIAEALNIPLEES